MSDVGVPTTVMTYSSLQGPLMSCIQAFGCNVGALIITNTILEGSFKGFLKRVLLGLLYGVVV